MSTMRIDFKGELKQYIIDKFLAGDEGENFNDETLLLDEQIIDSSGVLVLIIHIEQTYNISIDDDELIPENFNSINLLADLIQNKLN